MRIKDRKGLTAIVDAMIFIVIMGIAVSIMFTYSGNDEVSIDETSNISDQIFNSKIRVCDIIDIDDSTVMSMTDIVAASMVIEDKGAENYLSEVLNSFSEIPGSYKLILEYNKNIVTIGSGDGTPKSSYNSDFTIRFGGNLHTELYFY